jgi:hypothetical protein
MSPSSHGPGCLARQLLKRPRRRAGIDSHGEPVRLGERDTSGYLVGYIDDDGLAWESLRERIVAIQGQRLADALAPANPPGSPVEQALDEVPDELISAVALEAATRLWLKHLER